MLCWHTSNFIIVKYDISVIVNLPLSLNFYCKLNLCQAMSICLAKEQCHQYCERLIIYFLIVSSDYECIVILFNDSYTGKYKRIGWLYWPLT